MLMRDGQGQVSKAFAPASTLLPYQAATEYQRNYQRWAIPSQDPSTVPGPQYQEADLALEDISDDDDDVAAAVAPLHHAQAIKPPLSNGHASQPTALTHQPPVASHPVTGGKVSASFDSHPPSVPAPVSVPQNTTAPSQQWHVQTQDTIRRERARSVQYLAALRSCLCHVCNVCDGYWNGSFELVSDSPPLKVDTNFGCNCSCGLIVLDVLSCLCVYVLLGASRPSTSGRFATLLANPR